MVMVAVTFTNKIELCNLALNLIGANPIQGFADNTREAQLLSQNYELWVQQCLTKFQWRFAMDVAQCSKLADSPIPQWAYAYELPSDLISIVAVYLNRFDGQGNSAMSGDRLSWKNYKLFAGNTLCTNVEQGIWVHYRKRVREALWPSTFINYVAYYIAIQLCPMLGRQFDLQKQLIAYTYGAGANGVYDAACAADVEQYCPDELDADLLQSERESY